MAQISQIFEVAVDVLAFVGIAAFLWSVAHSLRMIASSVAKRG